MDVWSEAPSAVGAGLRGLVYIYGGVTPAASWSKTPRQNPSFCLKTPLKHPQNPSMLHENHDENNPETPSICLRTFVHSVRTKTGLYFRGTSVQGGGSWHDCTCVRARRATARRTTALFDRKSPSCHLTELDSEAVELLVLSPSDSDSIILGTRLCVMHLCARHLRVRQPITRDPSPPTTEHGPHKQFRNRRVGIPDIVTAYP